MGSKEIKSINELPDEDVNHESDDPQLENNIEQS
jgi:hypothetical protein